MMCVVTRDFVGAGEDYVRNQLVDSATFRNGETLITQRFLRPAAETEIKSARMVHDGEPAPVVRKKKKTLKAKIARKG